MWTVGPEITREEYLHLLDTAKRLDQRQAYLLVKVFATAGVSVLELPVVTVEAVRAGKLNDAGDTVPLAAGLREELTAYASWNGVEAGPVFVTCNGRPLRSSQVSRYLDGLSRSAGLDRSKCRPSALQKLYRLSKAEAEAKAAGMVEQIMNRQTDAERVPISPNRREKTVTARKHVTQSADPKKWEVVWPVSDDPGVVMTREDIKGYMAKLRATGRIAASQRYGGTLGLLYQDLPEDKRIRKGTLTSWVELLREKGYAPNTISTFAIIANGFVDYIGHREYQMSTLPKQEDNPQPELTRSEYLKLLQTAKALDQEREYLLVKLFASCDLPVQELDEVTVEAAKAGGMTVYSGGTRSMVHLPGCLCQELLAYADRQGIGVGPIFMSSQGKPMCRSNLVQSIAKLSEEAGVPRGKGNPASLRRLYRRTRAAVEASFAVLVEQAMERQMEQEQLTTGWEV